MHVTIETKEEMTDNIKLDVIRSEPHVGRLAADSSISRHHLTVLMELLTVKTLTQQAVLCRVTRHLVKMTALLSQAERLKGAIQTRRVAAIIMLGGTPLRRLHSHTHFFQFEGIGELIF